MEQPSLQLGVQKSAEKQWYFDPASLASKLEFTTQRLVVTEAELLRVLRENHRLRQMAATDEQLRLVMQEQLEGLRLEQFGASSERYRGPGSPASSSAPPVPPKPRVKKLTERYPKIPVREQRITQEPAPGCPCCGKQMRDSGMTEDSEQLTVIPKKFEILLQKRVKYRCSCQGAIATAVAPPRIAPGSSYSDEMIVDVALSKYCDLIPMERYAAMAGRGGLIDLPPQSLIAMTHALADLVSPAYRLVRSATLASRVLHADETPHPMLEGSDKKSWYLWGFSSRDHCFFECHDTRSGDVAGQILSRSSCEVLVSDVYGGYTKALRLANEGRKTIGKSLISSAYCNAHARRYFFKARKRRYQEAEYYLQRFQKIYHLESMAKGQPPPRILELRAEMRVEFETLRKKALAELPSYSEKSSYAKALRYFLENYEGLTLFMGDADVPIDNNAQERLLRSPVVGRKTWYGTHSEQGALTAAVLFTLVENCKLCGVNPREYFAWLVERLHAGHCALTPPEYRTRG
jgi:transposase